MSDDDLSLDFTSMVPSPPVPAVESVPPAVPEPPPPSPPEPPPAPTPPALPGALVEAADLHARGEAVDACRRLEAALKHGETRGEHEERTWLALFQLLQQLERKPAYESLALAFAKRFEKSPPAWQALAKGGALGMSTGGHAHVGLEGALDAAVGASLKQLMKLAQTNSCVRLDVGKLVEVDDDGCTLLLRALAALKKAKRECVVGRPEPLIALLQGQVVVGERLHEPMWQLLLELLQKTFDQTAFEEAAVNYAVTFEVSPPSWEGPAAPPPSGAPAAAVPSAVFCLEGQIIGAGEGDFAGMARLPASDDAVMLGAERLVRIDAPSAMALKTVLQQQFAAGRRVTMTGLSQLVAIFLEQNGCGEFATLRLRNA